MKRVLLTLLAAFLLCMPSLAQDLNFSAFEKPVKTHVNLSTASAPLGYKEACEIAKKTKQVIWVVRDVDNDSEVQAACEKANGLFVNADGDTDFNIGLSKLESIGSKILYVEMPPSAFPDKPQNKQYVINRDADRAELEPVIITRSANGKVSVPKSSVEIDPYAQPRWDANGQRVAAQLQSGGSVWRNADGSLYNGICPDGSRCVNGVCATTGAGSCATQQMQYQMPMQYQQPMMMMPMQMQMGGFMDGGFGGGFQGGSCGPGG